MTSWLTILEISCNNAVVKRNIFKKPKCALEKGLFLLSKGHLQRPMIVIECGWSEIIRHL